jgi:hypothetical protein
MAIAPVLKTGAREGLGVRIPHSPPSPFFRYQGLIFRIHWYPGPGSEDQAKILPLLKLLPPR